MDLDAVADRLIVPSFSRLGHAARSRGFDPLPRLDGRTVALTGPTSGIGEAAAEGFAALGARLVLIGRNRDKLSALAERLPGDHAIEVADLTSLADTRELADRLDAAALDVVVHNAGAMFDEHAFTEEGLERTLALNLVAPYLLTESLLADGLRPDARVVLVSSGGMYGVGLSLRDQRTAEGYRPAIAYARAKRGQVVLTEAWATALPDGPSFHAMHPGWADTPGVASSLPTFRTITRPFLRTPAEGADTILWLAADPDVPARSGRFWLDRSPRPTHYRSATKETPDQRERFLAELAALARYPVAA
jgi:NAD(P)-dependent dehydrogenase (short-subunit alcohol dehydrogenase family)